MIVVCFYFRLFLSHYMSVESGISFDPEQFRKKTEEPEEDVLEELVSGSEAQIKDRLDIWREIIQTHNEEKTPLEGQIGPDIHFILTDKEGASVNMVERLSCHKGYSYQLDIFSGGKNIAFLRYVAGGSTTPIDMGKTEVNPDFRKLGLNRLLFQHMTALHPDSSEVYGKMDSVNSQVYIDALKNGKTPVEAINSTPAGKVRIHADWELDMEQSHLPVFKEGQGISGIRPVYKRKDVQR